MTFLAQEQSVEGNSPVELYEFTFESQTFRYTSADAAYFDTATTRTYEPLIITHSNIEHSGDVNRGSIEFEVQYDAPFLELFRTAAPSGVVSVTIKRVHRTDTTFEIVTMWKGRILNVGWSNVTATLTCESIRASVQRFGLRRLFQYQCPHVLYSAICGVSKALYEVVGTVQSISGLNINVTGVSSFATTDYFAGGYIQYNSSTLITPERRMITNSLGSTNTLSLVSAPINLDIGSEVRVYPGCDHIITTCQSKFNNVANYGGFPYTPSKNPFGGEVIY